MRSSKSRSRSKSNRQRSIGNIINRVFDSSGPEGKVRGTPQQIIEKYLMLARDAQLSNDRVAAEAFLQHAEHYTRMLGEAQRELQREQEQRQGSQNIGGQNYGGQGYAGQGQNGNGQNGNGQGGGYQNDRRDQPRDFGGRDDQPVYSPDETQPEINPHGEADDSGLHRFVSGMGDDDREDDPGLVDTPEQPLETAARAEQAPRRQGQRPPRQQGAPRGERPPREPRENIDQANAGADSTEQSPKEERPRRAPRKPKAAAAETGDTPAASE